MKTRIYAAPAVKGLRCDLWGTSAPPPRLSVLFSTSVSLFILAYHTANTRCWPNAVFNLDQPRRQRFNIRSASRGCWALGIFQPRFCQDYNVTSVSQSPKSSVTKSCFWQNAHSKEWKGVSCEMLTEVSVAVWSLQLSLLAVLWSRRPQRIFFAAKMSVT